MNLNNLIAATFTMAFVTSALANNNHILESFAGKYTLRKAIAGNCYKKAEAAFDEANDTFSINQVFISNDGVNETDEINEKTIVNKITFADYDLNHLNSFPKVSVVRDGLAGYPLGTRSETYYLRPNEIIYTERAYAYFQFVPMIEVDSEATLKNDILTLKSRGYYPQAASGPKTVLTHCVFQKEK